MPWGESGRERSLARTLEALAATELGRARGLGRIASLADFRAEVPLLGLTEHAREVEAHLGFGLVDHGDPRAAELAGLGWERPEAAAIWRGFLGERPLEGPVVVLQAREIDRSVDRLLTDDLASLGAEVIRIDRADGGREALLEAIAGHAPAILTLPSVYTLSWLEGAARGPIERALPHLRLLLAGHDLSRRPRTRVRLESAGWIHRSGRLGIPSPRAPARAFTLAVGSQLVELLPHREPGAEGERVLESATILPEEAILGQRYELVVTSPVGCLRLRTDDHVEIVGFDPPTALAPFPRPRVVRLRPPPQRVALEGIALPGAWLTAAVRQAFRPEEPALIAATIGPDPSAVDPGPSPAERAGASAGDPFADTELGGAGRSGLRTRPLMPRRLLVQVELQGLGRRELQRGLATRIDDDLRRRSPAYDHLRRRRELAPPLVSIVDPGSFQAAQERRIASLRGRVGVPVVRVVGRERTSIFPSSTYGRVAR